MGTFEGNSGRWLLCVMVYIRIHFDILFPCEECIYLLLIFRLELITCFGPWAISRCDVMQAQAWMCLCTGLSLLHSASTMRTSWVAWLVSKKWKALRVDLNWTHDLELKLTGVSRGQQSWTSGLAIWGRTPAEQLARKNAYPFKPFSLGVVCCRCIADRHKWICFVVIVIPDLFFLILYFKIYIYKIVNVCSLFQGNT